MHEAGVSRYPLGMLKYPCLVVLLATACTFDSTTQASPGIADASSDTINIDASIIDAAATQSDATPPDAFVDPEACDGTLLDFEEGLDDGFPRVGVYKGIDFEDAWRAYRAGDFGVTSDSLSFDANGSTRDFAFEAEPQILKGFRVYWSGVPLTLTISDDSETNADVAVSLNKQNQTAFVPTNWASPSQRITVNSTAGFLFFLDDICYQTP